MPSNPWDIKLPKNNILGTSPYGLQKSKPKRQPVSTSQKNYVADRQGSKCAKCRHLLKRGATHYDHIREVSKRGKSTTDNIRALCANCHYERHNEDKAKKADKRRVRRQPQDPLAIKLPKSKNIWGI